MHISMTKAWVVHRHESKLAYKQVDCMVCSDLFNIMLLYVAPPETEFQFNCYAERYSINLAILERCLCQCLFAKLFAAATCSV